MELATIGLDIAKSVFQVHGISADGAVLLRKKISRGRVLAFFRALPRCLVGVEACPSAHFWARQIEAAGHEVRLMPPAYVKAYVKRQKNDAADAEAICEAVRRPTMRYVPIKSADMQAALMLHRSRDLLVRQRTMLVSALRGHMAEFGIVVAKGIHHVRELMDAVSKADDQLPLVAADCAGIFLEQIEDLSCRIRTLERKLLAWHRANEASRRLETVPGIGFITATAIAATVTDPTLFKSGRQFAAWLGLVPRQNSSGGKDRLGRISKQGNRPIRRLLVIGATAVVRLGKMRGRTTMPWVRDMLARKPARLVTVALANKTARIAWAVLARGESYRRLPLNAVA